ncbi:MAG: alginate export family protein [Xanthomonadales bacterium]|nr:alginate export family protein [Xanthomonadales bacterium]
MSMHPFKPTQLFVACLLALPVGAALAQSGTTSLEARLRYEAVDDDAFSRDAEALTARVRLGYLMNFTPAWSSFVEAEVTGHLGAEEFNSTENGQTTYPAVVDPDNVELNQAWVKYSPSASTAVTVGRQRLNFGNQRFIGGVGWRDNDQTFDALHVQHSFDAGPTLRYAYLDRVQRIFGDSHPNRALGRWHLSSHVLDASMQIGPGTLTGYAHWFDIETVPAASHRNLGLRYALKGGEAEGLGWNATAEFATQRPYADGADRNDAEYALIEGGVSISGNQFVGGVERLGGDGSYGFQTPFATLHAFNGWADRFLTTPANGLEDRYLGWKRGWGSWQAAVYAHDFRADRGGSDYGHEWDTSLSWAFAPKWSALIKWASYDSDGFGADVEKLWVQVEFKL